jgi:beta-galactosidase
MKRRNYWIMEQQVGNVNWTPYNPTFRPGEVGLKVWQSVAHGADGIVFFRWRAAQIGAELYHSGLLDHGGRPTRGYDEAKAIGRDGSRLSQLLRGSVPQAEVAFLHDYPSRWSLDLQPHNRDLADDQTFRRALMAPYEALWARNVPVHILPARGHEDLAAYKLVILPAINLLSPKTVQRLARYVEGGGVLIATARTGFKDEWGRVPGPPPGHLADLLGLTVEEIDSQPPGHPQSVRFVGGPEGTARASLWFEVLAPTSAHPLAVYVDDYYAGRAAATIRDTGVGIGRALYVGVLAGADFYGRLFDWLFSEASSGVEPLADTPPGVEASSRVGPERRILFLLNHNDAGESVVLPAGYFDALTGEPVGRELKLEARGVRILRM